MSDDTKAAPFYNGRNWIEDSAHENGQYQNTCCICHNVFVGHKRRVMCRVCGPKAAPSLADLLDERVRNRRGLTLIMLGYEEVKKCVAALRAVEAYERQAPKCVVCDGTVVDDLHLRGHHDYCAPRNEDGRKEVWRREQAENKLHALERAVEAVLAFPKTDNKFDYDSKHRSYYVEGYHQGYTDGVEAVQAILDGREI